MATIKETIEQGLRLLTEAGIPSARLDARVLLSHVLELDRAALYAYPERTLTAGQTQMYFALITRRAQHEPVAYLVGHKEFYGLDFLVDQRVLIPRPETELLVEMALQLIRQRITQGQIPLVADIGTGSGAIPISIITEEPALPFIYASDISSAALELARLNCERLHVQERVRLLQGDLLDALPEPIDLLLANLPYVGTREQESMEPDVYTYEPHLALFSGPEGLGLLERLGQEIQTRAAVKPGGAIILEIGYQHREILAREFQARWPTAVISSRQDYAGFDRFLQILL